jgi:hypothetical protein
MSTQFFEPSFMHRLRMSLLVGIGVVFAIVIATRTLVPGTSFTSIAAAAGIFVVYGFVAALGPSWLHQRHSDILPWATLFGLFAGAVFATEIILEYVLLPLDNTVLGEVEFGLVLALYFAAAFIAAVRSTSVTNAVLISMFSAFIASLIWAVVVLAVFHIFRGSPRQDLVLRAEGDYEDFKRSGMHDFNAFIAEDFMGATFFHLLLGPLVAAILGGLGAWLGKAIVSFRK